MIILDVQTNRSQYFAPLSKYLFVLISFLGEILNMPVKMWHCGFTYADAD